MSLDIFEGSSYHDISVLFRYALKKKNKLLIRELIRHVSKGYEHESLCERWYANSEIDPLYGFDLSLPDSKIRLEGWTKTCSKELRPYFDMKEIGIAKVVEDIVNGYLSIDSIKEINIQKALDKLNTLRKGDRELDIDDAEFVLTHSMTSPSDLIEASRGGLVGVVKFFLENPKMRSASTALVEALTYGRGEVADLLLSNGSTLVGVNSIPYRNGLIYANRSRDPKILSLLLEYDIPIEVDKYFLAQIIKDKNIPFMKILLLADLISPELSHEIYLYIQRYGDIDLYNTFRERFEIEKNDTFITYNKIEEKEVDYPVLLKYLSRSPDFRPLVNEILEYLVDKNQEKVLIDFLRNNPKFTGTVLYLSSLLKNANIHQAIVRTFTVIPDDLPRIQKIHSQGRKGYIENLDTLNSITYKLRRQK